MSDRVTRSRLEARLPRLAETMGYRVDGDPVDGERRLVIDYAACYGGYKLAEQTYRARERDGVVVPSGVCDVFGAERHSARELLDIMRAILDAFYRRTVNEHSTVDA